MAWGIRHFGNNVDIRHIFSLVIFYIYFYLIYDIRIIIAFYFVESYFWIGIRLVVDGLIIPCEGISLIGLHFFCLISVILYNRVAGNINFSLVYQVRQFRSLLASCC